jgi:peptide/nickel transport system substrate-binding protein
MKKSSGIRFARLKSRWREGLGMVLVIPALLGAEPRYGGKVVIGALGGIAPLNPITAQSTVAVNIFDLLFDRLLKETATGEIAPAVAVEWKASEDHLTWEFKLREDIHFHDGRPLTAEDVVFTFSLKQQYQGEEDSKGPSALQFQDLEAVNPYAVRMRFTTPPSASFLFQLREHILPRHLVEPQLHTDQALEALPFNRHPVGSGPFQFAEGTTGQVALAAFEEYWGGRPYLDTVFVKADYENTPQLWGGLMRGEVDVVTYASAEDLKSVQASEGFELVSGYGPGYEALRLNCRPDSPLSDRTVRRALNYAINRRAIWQYLGGAPTLADSLVFPTGPFAPESPYNDPAVETPGWDPKKTKDLLDAAGWRDSDGDGWREKEGHPLDLYLLMPTEFGFYQQVAGELRKDFEEVGIRLNVRQEPFVELGSLSYLERQRFDLLWGGGTYSLYTDKCVSWWFSSSPDNYSGYASAEADHLIEEARSSFDLSQRIRLYRGLHRRLMEDQPVIFLCQFPINTVLRRGLGYQEPITKAEVLSRIGLFRSLPKWYWEAE